MAGVGLLSDSGTNDQRLLKEAFLSGSPRSSAPRFGWHSEGKMLNQPGRNERD
jgi:hypothetical protein